MSMSRTLNWDDNPDLVVIQVYITNAYRSYEIADHYRSPGSLRLPGWFTCDLIARGSRPTCRHDLHRPGGGHLAPIPGRLADQVSRTSLPFNPSVPWKGLPAPRRDLIKRHLYLVPNSIVVSRGCPHRCDFCYKEAFFRVGKSFYTQTGGPALAGDRKPTG